MIGLSKLTLAMVWSHYIMCFLLDYSIILCCLIYPNSSFIMHIHAINGIVTLQLAQVLARDKHSA
jgi:uncharacterized protein YhhL (DUF1145 family)